MPRRGPFRQGPFTAEEAKWLQAAGIRYGYRTRRKGLKASQKALAQASILGAKDYGHAATRPAQDAGL